MGCKIPCPFKKKQKVSPKKKQQFKDTQTLESESTERQGANLLYYKSGSQQYIQADLLVKQVPSGDVQSNSSKSLSRQNTNKNSAIYRQQMAEIELLSNDQDINECYQIRQVIGLGIRSSTRAVYHIYTKEFRAAKIIRKDLVKNISELLDSIHIIKRVQHPNILQFHELFCSKQKFYFIFELCRGGDLLEKIVTNEFLSELDATQIFVQLLQAVQYLHQQNILLKCLRTESILFKESKDNQIKLIDITTSLFQSQVDLTLTQNPHYLAPEVIKTKTFTEKSDI